MSQVFLPNPSTTHDHGRRLLHSMQRDVPSPTAKVAVRQALGLSAVATAVVVSTAAVSTAATTTAASAATGKASGAVATAGKVATLVGSNLLKTALMGTLVGAALGTAAIGTSVAIRRAASPPASVQASPTAASGLRQPVARSWLSQAESMRGGESLEARPVGDRSVTAAPTDAAALDARRAVTVPNRASVQPTHKDSTSLVAPQRGIEQTWVNPMPSANGAEPAAPAADLGQVPATTASALPRETAQLARVRAALREGDAARGLAGLERYDHEFKAGVLRPEAAILRIEALMQTGNVVAARQQAKQFLATHPSSPHVPRIRKLVGL